MRRVIGCLIVMLLATLGQPRVGLAAMTQGGTLENLEYRMSLGIWSEVALVHLRLDQVGPNRYRAEFSGAAQGAWKLLSRWLPEGYVTEMILENGRLKPLFFREDFQAKGHRVRKEYRFDYSRKVLEVWRGQDYQEPTKRSEFTMIEPVYDPLSVFYNLRLGVFGSLRAGQNLRVATVPAPGPQQMILRFGANREKGRMVMIEMSGSKSEDQEGPYFVTCTPESVPLEGWIDVPVFGKLAGHLLNPGGIRPKAGLELPAASATVRTEP